MIRKIKPGQIAHKGKCNNIIQFSCDRCNSLLCANVDDGIRITTGKNSYCLGFRCPECDRQIKVTEETDYA